MTTRTTVLGTEVATPVLVAPSALHGLAPREFSRSGRWQALVPFGSEQFVFRVVDDWFISAQDVRQDLLDANATVEWTPSFYSKRRLAMRCIFFALSVYGGKKVCRKAMGPWRNTARSWLKVRKPYSPW